MAAPRVLIAGGGGVFGRLLARELLARTPATLLIAGRDRARAAAACAALGADERVVPLRLDLRDPEALTRSARGCVAVACAAGPFQSLPRALPAAAVAAGAHWLDIADDPAWVLPLLADGALGAAATRAGVAVVSGLSTVPALSGALVRRCVAAAPDARRARVTLFIGNRNAKGAGAIGSVLASPLDRPVRVALPIGRRLAFRFDSPDAALLREELGVATETRVAFEWDAAGLLLGGAAALCRCLGPAGRRRVASVLATLAAPLSRLGADTGCLQAEVWRADGTRRWSALLGHGQALAILPCALTLGSLLSGRLEARGVLPPEVWSASIDWPAELRSQGIRLLDGED